MNDNKLVLRIGYKSYITSDSSFRERLKSLFRYDNRIQSWVGYKTLDTVEFIENNKELIKNYPALKESFINDSSTPNLFLRFSELYSFQKKAIKKAVNLYHSGYSGFNLFFDVGLGKTITSLSIMDNIAKRKQVLILCPKSLRQQWKNEILKFDFALEKNIVIINGTKIKRQPLWNSSPFIKYFICTYETFRLDNPKTNFSYYILDEVTKVKNYKAKISRYLYQKLTNATFSINLTGTPIENKPSDLFNINKLHDRVTYNRSITKFNTEHAIFDQVFNHHLMEITNIISGYNNMPKFYSLISPHTFLLKKDNIGIELPEIIEINRNIENTKSQNRAENIILSTLDLEDNSIFTIFTLLHMLDDGIRTLQDSKSSKILFLKEKNLNKEITPKIEQLLVDLEEIGDAQVLIFSRFIKSSKIILKSLTEKGYNVKYYDGSEQITQDFKDNKFQILIAGDNLAHGISFSNVNYLINFSLHPNFAIMEQRKGRIHRINSKHKKMVFSYIGNIVGHHINEIIKSKKRYSNELNIIKQVIQNKMKLKIL